MTQPTTPESCEPHQGDYLPNAWDDYTFSELGGIVHFFVKRAGHRSNSTKLDKDLQDASNYLDMMRSKLDAIK